jgi:hypothetical protein
MIRKRGASSLGDRGTIVTLQVVYSLPKPNSYTNEKRKDPDVSLVTSSAIRRNTELRTFVGVNLQNPQLPATMAHSTKAI